MRVSVCVDPGRGWLDTLELAQGAEALGVDRLYVCDHFMAALPDGEDAAGPILEGSTLLAALGAATTRIGLGSLVLANTYRHPAVVANMAVTLDRITNGRFVLGLGAGWQLNEHAAYGIELPPPAARLERLEEACQLIQLLLTEEVSNFSGDWYSLTGARCDPKPVSRLPLLIGGGGERRTLRIAARFADEWHTWADPIQFRHKNTVLDHHCADAGRDPSTLRRSTGGAVHISTSSDMHGSTDDPTALTGTIEMAAARLHEFQTAGASEFIVRDHHDLPVPEALETLSLLANEVVPRLA